MSQTLWRNIKRSRQSNFVSNSKSLFIAKTYATETPNVQLLADQLSSQLNIKNVTDWYSKSKEVLPHLSFLISQDFLNAGAESLLHNHNDSPFELLSFLYPDYNWLPWKFASPPKAMWQNLSNQRKFLEFAAHHFHIQDMSDWYNIRVKVCIFPPKVTVTKDITSIGGAGLLQNHYNNSLCALLQRIYPEYPWLPWKFPACPRNYWDNLDNQRKFMDWAGKQLKINEMSDWYKITYKVGNFHEISLKNKGYSFGRRFFTFA